MKKLYLFCVAGMSTSMLARNMQKAADAHNLPFTVEAFPLGSMAQTVEADNPDCILIGPQASYALEETAHKYGADRPVFVIDSKDYGALDGERVLKAAIVAMKKFKAANAKRPWIPSRNCRKGGFSP